MGKKSDHISESLETIFWGKILKFLMQIRDPGWKNSDPGLFDSDPGSGMEKIRIRDI
jgi:hypothetical protein